MTTQIQPNISSELESLRKRIAQLEKRVTRLEEERDEARQTAVVQAMAKIIADGMFLHRGHYLPSESIRQIRLGRLALEQAIADRNERFPLFDDKVTLGEAYRMVA